MGLIGDLASKLFSNLWNGLKWIGQQIGSFFQSLIDILVGFIDLIFSIIAGIFYFIFKVGMIVVEFFKLIFAVMKILWSFVVGIGKTLASLTYIQKNGSGNAYSEMLGNIFTSLKVLQIDVIAYILLFVIWIITGFTAIKILGSLKGGE